jgi:hypothetical protein
MENTYTDASGKKYHATRVIHPQPLPPDVYIVGADCYIGWICVCRTCQDGVRATYKTGQTNYVDYLPWGNGIEKLEA